ncbi:MAG: glycosyltransferase [Holophagales bacterium]|nr:glycosyltransferase [Holophagales bacterium]
MPMRDEAANADDCLETLLPQRGATRVVAIDDHSRDATPEILARRAAADPRLEVRAAPPLPPGWGGKVHALATGAAGADEPWLLATDADTRHAPELLARAHAAAREHDLDLLSLAGRQEARGFVEGLLVPAVFVLLDALLGDWRAHSRGEAPVAIANGQFLLVRRAALESIGGFAALAVKPLDDVELARALRAGGHRTGFRRAGDALEVRMYRGGAAAISGWRRNLALFVAPRGVVAALALLALLLPPALLAAALASGHWLAAGALWAGGALGSLLGRGLGGRPELALLYPLDALLAGATLAAACLDHARGALRPWRGRDLPSRGRGDSQPGSGAR